MFHAFLRINKFSVRVLLYKTLSMVLLESKRRGTISTHPIQQRAFEVLASESLTTTWHFCHLVLVNSCIRVPQLQPVLSPASKAASSFLLINNRSLEKTLSAVSFEFGSQTRGNFELANITTYLPVRAGVPLFRQVRSRYTYNVHCHRWLAVAGSNYWLVDPRRF